MSVRLPSQKRFAPSRPKGLGGRPGGPTVGAPKAPAAGFAQPRVPFSNAAAAGHSAAGAAESATTEDGNATAGPSRSDVSTGATLAATGAPADATGTRPSSSPVTRPSGVPPSVSAAGNYSNGNAGERSTARTRSPTHSPVASLRRLDGDIPPTLSPTASIRPSPAPRPAPRVSASPAPSSCARSLSRQPSMTPSIRSGKRPSLIAAAENRQTPLNIVAPPKARRKAEKARAAEEAERQSEMGTPDPSSGLPPTLGAVPLEAGDINRVRSATPRQPSTVPGPRERRMEAVTPAPRSDNAEASGSIMDSAAMAERLVQQLRQMRQSASPAPSGMDHGEVPLFMPADSPHEAEVDDGYGAPDELLSGEEDEQYDEDGQIIRQDGSQAKKKGKAKAPVKRNIATQRKKFKRKRPAKEDTTDEEEAGEGGDGSDGEPNELDISDDEDMDLAGPNAGKRRIKGKKRRRKTQRQSVFQPVNLDEAEVGEMIGEEVDEENMQMADIATRRSGEGKVSARAKELNVYLRDFGRRNKDRLYEENLERYERRQVLRRQIRALRNAKREERRAEVREQGGDPEDEVSEDEPNSETEFEVRPERLTPPSSPEPGGAGAERPQREREDGDEEEIEEQEYVEPPEGAALGLGLDDDEDDEAAPEEPEEEIFDPNTHMPADTHERHEDEEFDPELAALGFTSGPSRYNEDEEEVDPDAGASLEQLYEELNDTRRTALQRNMEREVIEEEQTGKMPNSRSYAKKVNNERWSAEETEFFYQVLGETGENYTMMSFYFPGRTQRQLKNKGRKENAAHPDRVNEAIRARRPIDPDYLAKTVGYDPSGSTDNADQLLEETRDLPARWTREDTDRALADIREEGDEENGERVEEVQYEESALVDGEEKEDDEMEGGDEDEEEGADLDMEGVGDGEGGDEDIEEEVYQGGMDV